jgi:hypothetical protein
MTICLILPVLAACNHEQTHDATANTNEEKYTKAYEMLEKKNYEEAYALFIQLGDYKNAAKEAAYFRYMPTYHRIEYVSDENETITYTVTLNDKNLPATVVEEYNTGLKHTCTFTYNEFGYVTRRECSDTDGVRTLYEATYDANGNCLSDRFTDKDGNVSKFECTYNEKGEILKVVTNNVPGYYLSYTCTYDADGREIKVVYEYEDGFQVEENTYNAAGDIVKKTVSNDGKIDWIEDYKYDEKGRLEEIVFTEEGNVTGFKKITYNNKDQKLTEHIYYTFGYECTNSYEYDEHGNVIKETYINPDTTIGNDFTESAYKLVYIPFEYTEAEWMTICDSTKCWDWSHFMSNEE